MAPNGSRPAAGRSEHVTWQAVVQLVVDETLRAADMPGLLLAIERPGRDIEYLAAGADERGTPLGPESLFAVASITKPATALAVLRLAAEGRLALDAPLPVYLPETVLGEGATARALLCHTSGAPLEPPLGAAPYTADLSWAMLARACLATPAERQPWTRVDYSNVGYGLAATVVERVTGLPFNTALSELVLHPLGIEGYLGVGPPRPAVHLRGIIGEHAGTALEPFNSAFWRALALPWGGLVTTAAGALGLARAFSSSAGFLPPATAAEATSDQTRDLPGGIPGFFEWPHAPWGLGVELRGFKAPHWLPPGSNPDSFGHVGSSGCLVWCDPGSGLTWAVLGTRRLDAWSPLLPALNAAILAAAM